MHVYAVQNAAGLVKVGRTKNPTARVKALTMQGGFAPVSAWVSVPMTNPQACEAAVHAVLAGMRSSGEWFAVDFDAAVNCICENMALSATKETNNAGMGGVRQRIVAARKQAGMTQVALAAAAGVTQQAISFIESGRASATKHLPAIAKALGLRAEDLLSGVDADTHQLAALLSPLTHAQRQQALRMLEAYAASCRSEH